MKHVFLQISASHRTSKSHEAVSAFVDMKGYKNGAHKIFP